jgi:hypothetical protein
MSPSRGSTPRQTDRLTDLQSQWLWISSQFERVKTRVEAGLNTSTVTLRVVGGDEMGNRKSETVKYSRESQETRTRERTSSIYERQTRPLVRESGSQKQDRNCQTVMNIWSWVPDGVRHQDLVTDWPSSRNVTLILTLTSISRRATAWAHKLK